LSCRAGIKGSEEKRGKGMKNWIAGIIGGIGIVGLVCGILLKAKCSITVPIIGGADGPTSIFIAGKAADGAFIKLIMSGAGLIGLSILLLLVRKKNK